ncbi:MAG: response regulator [Geobacteraceae bacterium]|nr:response regulator [Geobacteraceae bacterium]
MAKKRILLADDVQLFLEMEKTFLSRDAFDVQVAHNGKEVLDALAQGTPNLIFMDLFMPDMNGDECCRMIKADPARRQIPIVMVTSSGREEDLRRCRDAGCDDIILKPINREHFMETAKRFLQIEERAAPRYMARLRIHFGQDDANLLADYTINLSTGGVFLETTRLMPAETPLIAEFVLPSNNVTIRCKAKVAWVNHPELMRNPHLPVGLGLQFLDITMADMDAIRHYIREEKLLPSW